MHPPHIPKILIKKSCLLWIRMVLENFYRYKKNQTNKKQAICFLLKRTLQTNIPWKLSFYMKPYKIDVICSTNHYYSCLLTLSLIGIITPPDFYCSLAPIFSQLCPCHVPVHVIYWWSNTLSTAASDVQNVIIISFLC